MRHAWSLAIEEQFYILYPLLLVVLLSLIRRRLMLMGVVLALAGGSALLMTVLHQPGIDLSRVYYGTDTRAHQLLVGAAFAVFISSGPGEVDRWHVRKFDLWCRRLALLIATKPDTTLACCPELVEKSPQKVGEVEFEAPKDAVDAI